MSITSALKVMLLCGLLLSLAACDALSDAVSDDDSISELETTLEPSRIAADSLPLVQRTATDIAPIREPARIDVTLPPLGITEVAAQPSATNAPSATDSATATASVTTPPTASDPDSAPAATQTLAPTDPPAPTESPQPTALPTSNYAGELLPMQDNASLAVAVELSDNCFLTGEQIPFTLRATNIANDPIYFYQLGRWLMSINNTPPGPQIVSQTPTATEEFLILALNETYTQQEADIGSWVQSLGPEYWSLIGDTSFGLQPGEYWLSFMYNNDQDGLQEQFDNTFFIPRAAWRGTAVSPEVRFRVVDDLSEC